MATQTASASTGAGNTNPSAPTVAQPGGPTPQTVVKPDLTDLEENVNKVTKKMYMQLARLKDSYTSNKNIPDNLKKIFQNIMTRCYIEINFVRESNFADPRQTALRLVVDEKLDLLRKDISKLKKIVDDIKSLNKGNENHVCRDVKNLYSQVGKSNAF
ncbi:hypothetical protein HA402_010822 [Bradysia odoriphaga]|nr:hypothetical protein HA402_010822 [Bradysia odoriphaga]